MKRRQRALPLKQVFSDCAGVRLDDLELAREYLRGKDEPCVGYYNERDVVLDRPAKTFFHCVHVQGNERTGKVVGYVEYFGYMRLHAATCGYMRIVALLSNAYGGSGIMECCAINPVGGAELNLSANRPDFTTQDIQNIYDYGMVDFDVCGKALEPLIESYVATSSRRETQRVVGEAVEYARDNCGAKLGEAMTEKQQVRFVDLVLKRLTPFLLHQLARPDFRGGTGRTFQSD